MPKKSEQQWIINPLQAPSLPGSVPIPEQGLTLGRDPANGLEIPADRFPGVSSHHARLVLRDDRPVLEDLESKNGTLVEGRRIETRAMKHGEIFQLGSGGPRFAVLLSSELGETVLMPRRIVTDSAGKHSIGAETTRIMRERLGISGEGGVDRMLKRRGRRQLTLLVLLILVAAGSGGVAYWYDRGRSRAQAESLQAVTDARVLSLEAQLQEARAQVEAQRAAWTSQGEELERVRNAWQEDKLGLEKERAQLQTNLQQLEEEELADDALFEKLRIRLEETNRTLEAYNPLNLESSRLSEVARIEKCTVLVETTKTMVESESRRPLYVKESDSGDLELNFSDDGDILAFESTGSGFCVSPEGWVITNAHVVGLKREPDGAEVFQPIQNVKLEEDFSFSVIFSGEEERHEAELVRWASEGDQDLALLKIEPFEGMSVVGDLDLELVEPIRGSEVFVIGFPLGKQVLHTDDTMIASTFRGIISRVLDTHYQVDAAIHPGASGGPVIDGRGRILGVVVGMQRLDEETSTSAIGYIIPARNLSSIWPPPAEESEPVPAREAEQEAE